MNDPKHPKVAAAQYPITAFRHWAEWEAHVLEWCGTGLAQGAGLLVFPEYGAMELMSLSQLPPHGGLLAHLDGMQAHLDRFLAAFEGLSRRLGCVVVAPSLPVWEHGRYVNRAHVFGPRGLAGWQDKFFMTRFEDEEWGIHPSTEALTVFEADWGAFGVQICYDVEFPLGSALLCAAGAQLIAVPSCTETIRGATRVHVGARARALENQCYALVSQTVGEAPWSPVVDLNYGYGACYAPPDRGMPETGVLGLTEPNAPTWLAATLDMDAIAGVRIDGQVFNFRDQQRIHMQLDAQAIEVRRVRL